MPGGGAEAQNGKGSQSDPNHVPGLLDCVDLPVFHIIITAAYLLYRSGPVAIYFRNSDGGLGLLVNAC